MSIILEEVETKEEERQPKSPITHIPFEDLDTDADFKSQFLQTTSPVLEKEPIQKVINEIDSKIDEDKIKKVLGLGKGKPKTFSKLVKINSDEMSDIKFLAKYQEVTELKIFQLAIKSYLDENRGVIEKMRELSSKD